MLSDETWDVLAESWGEQQLMEFPVLVGVYAATAMQQNSLRVPHRGRQARAHQPLKRQVQEGQEDGS